MYAGALYVFLAQSILGGTGLAMRNACFHLGIGGGDVLVCSGFLLYRFFFFFFTNLKREIKKAVKLAVSLIVSLQSTANTGTSV